MVPANVTITTRASSGAVKVTVPTGKAGFVMNSPSSSITSASGAPITITTTVSGTPTGGTDGIVAGTGSATTTQISNVTVTGMLGDGILVNGSGVLSIGAGVVSTSNGVSSKTGNGLEVTGAGQAIIAVASGATATQFNQNTAHGILVEGGGSINLTGAVVSVSAGTGTVEANGNTFAGVWIEQTPGIAAPAQNVLDGLVAFANTSGNGMRIVASSRRPGSK